MDPPIGRITQWKRKAMERSYHAGLRYNKHLRKMNKLVPRPKTKSNDAEDSKDQPMEDVTLNSLISNLAQRSTEFGITMEEDDDIADCLLPDGLAEEVPVDDSSELVALGICREAAVMSPEVVGCVTIDGVAFRTFTTEADDNGTSSWEVKTEQGDQDVKPNVEELNKVLFPTKTSDITKIKGWRNKVFAENDDLVVKLECEENWDEDNEPVDQSRPVDSTPTAVNAKNVVEKSKLLNCALTLPYKETRALPPAGKRGPNSVRSTKRVAYREILPAVRKPVAPPIAKLPVVQAQMVQPLSTNPNRKPKTKAEYRRMLEEAARSQEVDNVVEAPVAPQQPTPCGRRKFGPKWAKKDMEPAAVQIQTLQQMPMKKQMHITATNNAKLNRISKSKMPQVRMSVQHELDSRFMYALVEGRPIKIGGSIVAKLISDAKSAPPEPVKTLPQKVLESRYTSLLEPPKIPKLSTPIVKRKNLAGPLSKKLAAKKKHLQEFCLRLHPAIGFPLTESAFQQISLLRDDLMEVNDDWINFATTVVDSKKKNSYHRKGFVDKVIPTADVLLPVKVVESGTYYEPGNMENFNTINVPVTNASDDSSLNDQQKNKDPEVESCEISKLLRCMVDSVAKQETVEDLHLLAEPKQSKESSGEQQDFLNPTHGFLNPTRAVANPRKRRSALNAELRRLNVLVIEEQEPEDKEVPKKVVKPAEGLGCKQEHCKFGCLCLSLERSGVEASHCGRADCMFDCICGGTQAAEERNALPKSVVSKITESTKYLARTEKEFQRAVVCNKKNEMLVVDGCAAPATGRRKREVKLPVRFRDSGIDDKLLFGGNANLEVMEARKNEKKMEEPQNECVEEPFTPPPPNEDIVCGIRGRPYFVPNHSRCPEFFRRRAKNLASEQQYRMTRCDVTMFRAKLDNVEPLCIIHNEYSCPCIQYFSSHPAVDSSPGVSPVRSPGRKPQAQQFHAPAGKRRNVAVKKTAPRSFPKFGYRDRCSRTEGVSESYVLRNRKATYTATLAGRQKTFQARLYGTEKSATIPGSRILPNEVPSTESLSEKDKERAAAKSSDSASQYSHKKAVVPICTSLLNPTQIIPSNFKPKKSKNMPATEFSGVVKGTSLVQIPPGSETKMMRWSLLQDSFLNNSLQMWLSSPEIGVPKLYVSSNLKAPDVKCRNLRNWTGKTEHGYPPLVDELMKQIPNESAADMIRYGVMLKRKDHWEVIGIRKLPRTTHGDNPVESSNNVKFLKNNAIMSVPLPAVRSACRWHVIYIDCHFDRIVFQGCVIVEKNIIQLRDGSQSMSCVNAILFQENFPSQFKALSLPSMFGLYALPKIRECVFLGPFGLESSKGDVVNMFKDVTANGKDSTTGRIFVEVIQPKSRSAWLYAEGLSDNEAANYMETLRKKMILELHSESPVVKKAVAPHDVTISGANESLARKRLSAAVESYNKGPMSIAASMKSKMQASSSFQRKRIGNIAAKKVAASKEILRKTQPSTSTIETSSSLVTSPIRRTAATSLLKGAPYIPKEQSEFPVPVDTVIEEVTTSDETILSSPPRFEATKISTSGVFAIQNQPQPLVSKQVELSPREVVQLSPRVEKQVGNTGSALGPFRTLVQFDKAKPPPLVAMRRHSSTEFLRSRTPSVDYGSPSPGRPDSAASSCSGTSNVTVPAVNQSMKLCTAKVANRPGLTITGKSSVLKRAVASRRDKNEVTEVLDSDDDDDIEFIPAAPVDNDIMVVPSTWQPGSLPPDLPADYEPAEINTTNEVTTMYASVVDGSRHVKYVPSIPSLGYVEAYRLPDGKIRIRLLSKAFLEASFSSDAIRPYLDKAIRDNPMLVVEPPDLPLTWVATEDMDSRPDVFPFNYAKTFDGNHMLCEKGLLRKKVVRKAVSKQDFRDVDIIALEQLKKVIKVPSIDGVSLEDTLSQAAAEILQCQRLEQVLVYKRSWWLRRRKKTRKRLIRSVLSLPGKDQRRHLFEVMDAILKSSRPIADDSSIEIVEVPDESSENANDRWSVQDVDIMSGSDVSLSVYTPRRLEAILFPAEKPAPIAGPGHRNSTQPAPKNDTKNQEHDSQPRVQLQRSPNSLLRKSLQILATSEQTLIPLMDLTDDDAQPTVVLQKRPELPLVVLDDDDDDQELPPPKQQCSQSNSVDRPKVGATEKNLLVYSYGVNAEGHYFRCAILNGKIVNAVRITQVPPNTECLQLVVQSNTGVIRKRVGVNTTIPKAVVTSGLQTIGIRAANVTAQGGQQLTKEVIMVAPGTSNVNSSFSQMVGSMRLANSREILSKEVTIHSPPISNVSQVGAAPGRLAPRPTNQGRWKEIIVVNKPPIPLQTNSPVPRTIGVRMANARLQGGIAVINKEQIINVSPTVSNVCQSVGEIAGTAPKTVSVVTATVPTNNIQIGGDVDASDDDEPAMQKACEIVDQLISTGHVTGSTRQIVIKGPPIPNILKRQQTPRLQQGDLRDVHVTFCTPRNSPSSQPGVAIQTEKQLVKISPEHLKKLNTIVKNGNVGKTFQLKLKTTPKQVRIISEKSPENKSMAMGTSVFPVVNEITALADTPKQSAAANEVVDSCENLVPDSDKEADEDNLIIDEGFNSEAAVDVVDTESVNTATESYPEMESSEIDKQPKLVVQVDSTTDSQQAEAINGDNQDASQTNDDIVDSIPESQVLTVHLESVDELGDKVNCELVKDGTA